MWWTALITLCVGQLDAKSLLCVFNHFKDSFEQSCGWEKKTQTEIVDKKSIFSYAEFFWWLEYFWMPNKGAYPAASEKEEGNRNIRNPLCFWSRAFGLPQRCCSGFLCSHHEFTGWGWWPFHDMNWLGFFLGLLASKQQGLTYIWRSRGLSWAACDQGEAQKYTSEDAAAAERWERPPWQWPSNHDSQRNIGTNRTFSEVQSCLSDAFIVFVVQRTYVGFW